MNRVLLDQGLSPKAAELLRAAGWEALHVSDLNLAQAEDSLILEYARSHDYCCVTLDHDFHSHLALTSSGRPSVVLLRVEGLKAAEQATLIEKVWSVCASSIDKGAAVSADENSVRIRSLPLK